MFRQFLTASTRFFNPYVAMVPERMDASGAVVTPLDEAAVRAATIQLREAGCEALVIHFLHAYANPAHEIAAGRIAADGDLVEVGQRDPQRGRGQPTALADDDQPRRPVIGGFVMGRPPGLADCLG